VVSFLGNFIVRNSFIIALKVCAVAVGFLQLLGLSIDYSDGQTHATVVLGLFGEYSWQDPILCHSFQQLLWYENPEYQSTRFDADRFLPIAHSQAIVQHFAVVADRIKRHVERQMQDAIYQRRQ
jgi:hypothetical protein